MADGFHFGGDPFGGGGPQQPLPPINAQQPPGPYGGAVEMQPQQGYQGGPQPQGYNPATSSTAPFGAPPAGAGGQPPVPDFFAGQAANAPAGQTAPPRMQPEGDAPPDFFGGASTGDLGSGVQAQGQPGIGKPAAAAAPFGAAGFPTNNGPPPGTAGAGSVFAAPGSVFGADTFSGNAAQPYINLQIDPEDVLAERAPSGVSGRGQNNTLDSALDTKMGLFVQTATSGGSFKQVKPELAHKYGVDVGTARAASVNAVRRNSQHGLQSLAPQPEGDKLLLQIMSTRSSASTMKAVTLDFEAPGLSIEKPGDRDIFDLVVQAENTQEQVDQVFFGFQGMLVASSILTLYILWGYWSSPGETLDLMKLFEPGLSRITFALAQIASVGALLRLVKCYEHLRAFEVYENNFSSLREQAQDQPQPMFSNYSNLTLLSENRVPVVKQAGLCVAQAVANVAVVCLCMITSYNDMRIKNGRVEDYAKCPGGSAAYTSTYAGVTGGSLSFATSSAVVSLTSTIADAKTVTVVQETAPACACACAECCWKGSGDLEAFEGEGFTSWRVQTMVKAFFALIAFGIAVRERATTFYYCTFPVVQPKGI